jgi:hypothetical protein
MTIIQSVLDGSQGGKGHSDSEGRRNLSECFAQANQPLVGFSHSNLMRSLAWCVFASHSDVRLCDGPICIQLFLKGG